MSIQIFILSKLMEGNSYPYKLKKQLSGPLPLDQLAGLTESKMYYHFDSLAKKGLIESVEIIKEEHRPDKQLFAITSKGRDELPKLIYKVFEDAREIKDMVLGLASLQYVSSEKVIGILEKKAADTKLFWEQLSEMGDKVEVNKANEKLVDFMKDYLTDRTKHTVYWLEESINWIKQKEL